MRVCDDLHSDFSKTRSLADSKCPVQLSQTVDNRVSDKVPSAGGKSSADLMNCRNSGKLWDLP